MQCTSFLSGSRKCGGAPFLRSSVTFSLSIGLFRRAFQSSFPFRNISSESPSSVLVAILRGKPQKFSVNPSQQLLKRERVYFRSARGRETVSTIGHMVVKKKKNIKLKIDLLNKIFPLICNTQIPNNLQILCLTSINCLFFLFSNSWNRIIFLPVFTTFSPNSKDSTHTQFMWSLYALITSEHHTRKYTQNSERNYINTISTSTEWLFTFSKKQPQENEAIWLTIIILSLNNRKSWKCFNSRLPNTTPKFSVQRNTTCYNVVATSCKTVVAFLSSSDKREVNVRSQSRTSCFYFEYLELHNFISLPLKLETPQRRLFIRKNESSTQIKWKNSIHALICNNIRSELNYY